MVAAGVEGSVRIETSGAIVVVIGKPAELPRPANDDLDSELAAFEAKHAS